MAEKILIEFEVQSQDAQKGAANLIEQIERLSNSRRELRKRLQELQKTENDLVKTRKTLSNQLDDLQKAGRGNTQSARDLRNEINRLDDEIRTTGNSISDTANELAINNKTTQDARKELRQYNKELGAVEGSLEAQRALLIRLKKEFVNLSPGINTTEEAYNQLRDQIKELNDDIKEQEFAFGQFGRNVGNYTDSVKAAFGETFGGFAQLRAAITSGPLLVGALVTGLGQGAKELKRISEEIAKQREEVEKLTGATGAELDRLTAKVSATSDVLGQSFSQTLEFINKSSTIFAESEANAADLFAQAAATQADNGESLISSFESVAGRYRDAGLDLSTTLSIIAQEQGKVGEQGKGVEAIAEAFVSLREATDPTREAIEGLGLDSALILKQFETDAFGAVQTILGQFGKFEDRSPQIGAALADIFRGAGEDAGLQYLKTLTDVNTSLDEVVENSGAVARRQIELIRANEKLDLAFNQALGGAGGLFKEVEIAAKNLLADGLLALINGGVRLINFFREAYNESAFFRAGIQAITVTVKNFFDLFQAGFQQTVNTLSTFGELWKAVITGNFREIPGIIKEGFTGSIDIVKDLGSDLGDNFTDGFNEVFQPKKLELITLDDGTINKAVDKYRSDGKKLGVAFGEGITGAAKPDDIAKTLSKAIEGLSVEGIEQQTEELKTLTESRIEEVKQAIARENLLYNQQRAKGIADERVYQNKLLQLQREQLGLELALIDKEGTDKINKQNELAEIEAKIYETKEARKREEVSKTEEAEKKALEEKRKRKDAEIGLALQTSQATQQTADAIINLAGEETEAGKAAIAAKKIAAAAEIGLNLQREISAYWATNAGVPVIGPGLASVLSIAAGVRAAASLATIAAFADGGPTIADGGMINSPKIGLIGEKGTEWVAPNWMLTSPKLAPVFNQLEGIRSGVKPFADGGFTTRQITQQVINSTEIQNSIKLAVESIPPPVVSVTDINKGQRRVNNVKVRASK